MLTLRALVEDTGLELRTGAECADAPVRWVHITELPDPTPWLSGGELILTTGLQLADETVQREFVRRLSERQLAGLGFGTGFAHDTVPEPILEQAELVGLPVFEVPYEVPFIALTERAFTRLVNDQYEVLQRGTEIHRRLERLVLEERGLGGVARALATAIGGAVIVLDAHGGTLALANFRRVLSEASLGQIREAIHGRDLGDLQPLALVDPELAGRSLALPISAHVRGAAGAWLVAVRDSGELGDFERLILTQAATVVALELLRQRAMRDTERRLAGDVLAEALGDDAGPSSDRRGPSPGSRLRPFDIGTTAAVLVFEWPGLEGGAVPGSAEAELDRLLLDDGVGALVASRDELLCAIIDGADGRGDPVALAERARAALSRSGDGDDNRAPRAAASRVAPVSELRRSFHEARCALAATAHANGSAPAVASHRDLGAFHLLLSLQDDDALRAYCDGVLAPVEAGGAPGDSERTSASDYGEELLRSLEAFIECNGQWEKASRLLFCHRHTLRYRIRRVEQLSGRDLSSAQDRIEFWLALRGRELLA